MADLKDSVYQPFFRHHMREANASGTLPEGMLRTNAVRALAVKDSGVLAAEVKMNPNVEKFLSKVGSAEFQAKIDQNQGRGLSDAIIKQYKTDKDFVSKLEKDLSNPAAAAKLEAAIVSNPAGVSANLKNYKGGNLDAIIPAAATASAPATPTAQTSTETSADAAASETARLARRSASSTQPAATPAPAATPGPAAKPAAAAPAAPVAPIAVAAAAGVDKSLDDPAPPSNKDLSREAFRKIAAGSDDQIRKSIDSKFVEDMANGLADYGVDTYGKEMEGDANAFRNKIKSDPALRQRIADNLKNNPQLVRGLSEAMDDPNASKGMVGSAVKGKLKEIYTNPAALGDKDYTDKLTSDMNMAKGMGGGGMGGMLNGLFGSSMGGSMGGIMNSIGGFLKGIMNWLGNFFKGFSSGNFSVMGNVDPKMSMWDKVSQSMDRAERANQLLPYAQTLPRDGTTNPKIGDGKVVDANGKPVMEDVKDASGKKIGERQQYDATQDHRVTVNGKQFYLTNGLQPTPVYDKNGTFTGSSRWVVATEVDANGRPTAVNEYVFNREDSERLNQRTQQAARAVGTTATFQDPATVPQQLERSNIQTQRIERVRGQYQGDPYSPQESPANQPGVTSPVQQGTATPRPLDPLPDEQLVKKQPVPGMDPALGPAGG